MATGGHVSADETRYDETRYVAVELRVKLTGLVDLPTDERFRAFEFFHLRAVRVISAPEGEKAVVRVAGRTIFEADVGDAAAEARFAAAGGMKIHYMDIVIVGGCVEGIIDAVNTVPPRTTPKFPEEA